MRQLFVEAREKTLALELLEQAHVDASERPQLAQRGITRSPHASMTWS
jgi:hypothetical protein